MALTNAHHLGLPDRTVPFVGRDEELIRMREWAANPDNRLLVVTGVAGVGKSALVREFISQCDVGEVIWVGPGSTWTLESTLRLNPDHARGPRLVVLDDDQDSIQGSRSDDQRIGLVVSALDGDAELRGIVISRLRASAHVNARVKGVTQLDLDPLRDGDSRLLLASLLGSYWPEALAAALWSEGNPLIVRLLAEFVTASRKQDGAAMRAIAAELNNGARAPEISRPFKLYVQSSLRSLGTTEKADIQSTDATGSNLVVLSDLAAEQQSAGLLKPALAMYEELLSAQTTVLGADHPNTLATLSNLAGACYESGDLQRAIVLFEEALADMVRVLRPDHPSILATRTNLAGAYRSSGDVERAIPLFELTLADMVRVLGPDHPQTLTTRNNLAGAYYASGGLDRAIPLFEQTLADMVRILGPDHPQTLTTRNNLAGAYYASGGLDRAIPLFEQILADSVRILGPDHPQTLTTRNNLAGAYEATGDVQRAILLFEQTLADRVRVLGPDHPQTLTTRNNLAGAYETVGDQQRAIHMFEQTLADMTRVRETEWSHADNLTLSVKPTLAIIDDQASVRYRLARAVARDARIIHIGGNLSEVTNLFPVPDILMLGFDSRQRDYVSSARAKLKSAGVIQRAGCRIVLVSTLDKRADLDLISRIMNDTRISGFVSLNDPPETLVAALRASFHGKVWHSPHLAVDGPAQARLSPALEQALTFRRYELKAENIVRLSTCSRETGASQLVDVEAVIWTLRSIVGLTTGLIGQVRLNGVEIAEKRQLLRTQLEAIGRAEFADAILRLTRQNIEHITGLYELAEARASSAGYLAALAHAEHASRLLADNLDRFVREVITPEEPTP